jgi:hypothetical protein
MHLGREIYWYGLRLERPRNCTPGPLLHRIRPTGRESLTARRDCPMYLGRYRRLLWISRFGKHPTKKARPEAERSGASHQRGLADGRAGEYVNRRDLDYGPSVDFDPGRSRRISQLQEN